MNNAKAATGLGKRKHLNRLMLAAGVLLGLGTAAVLVFVFWPRSQPEMDQNVEDPRITYQTHFRNVRPGVRYVGDEVCGNCHPDLNQSFHRHSMGKSLAPIAAVAANQKYGDDVHNPFHLPGMQYLVKRQGDRIVHQEVRSDSLGRVIADTQAQMNFVIGSGERAYSYLYKRDDRLFQSPISWFTQKQRWDLSPGYETLADRFERPITASCLFCHCNYVEPVEDTINRFKMPLFPRGAAIGCERCHGPGELHVKERNAKFDMPADGDDTIVNPRRLPPALRESVCQQCHLEGESIIYRRGRREFEFRPGMPLHLFLSIFVAKPDLAGHNAFVGQVEQMYVSRCFTESKGKLGCISCHDPHVLPTREKRPEYFRNKCMNCHQDKGCSEPMPVRHAKNKNNCYACHMPRLVAEDVRHTAVTEHRVLRRPKKHASHAKPRQLGPGESPIVHFHKDLVAAGNKELDRDLALALVELVKRQTSTSKQLAETAYPLLAEALKRAPADEQALQAMAHIHDQKGRPQAALELIEKILARTPDKETALEAAATYAERADELKKALKYAGRLVKLNPRTTRNRAVLTAVLIRSEKYDKAISQCKETLKFNPGSVAIRSLLVSCYLNSGRKLRARQEFEAIIKLNPSNLQELRSWFEQQMR